ncbi:GNAT family N-acetyltransferase [Phocaeicola sp.]
MTTRDEVKALWKLCFNDSDEFTDLYFDMRYKDELNMAVRRDGKIISALQMIPYPMTFCGETIATSYISGACTHPGYREHGAMRQLLKDTHRRMYRDGVLLSTLIPAEKWLFGYYAKSGYAPSFGYAVEKVSVDGLHPSVAYEVTEESTTSPFSASGKDSLCVADHYSYFDARMQKRNCCIQHFREDFLVIMADLRLGGGKLLVARQDGRIAGMAFCVAEGGTLYVKELLADDDAVKDTLLSRAAYIYNVRAMELMVPSSSNTLYLGMARVIHAGKMLSLFAKKYPDARLYLELEGDDTISENNGFYTVEKGIYTRGRVDGKKYHTYTIDCFTRLLLEAEHPYMSLMLN